MTCFKVLMSASKHTLLQRTKLMTLISMTFFLKCHYLTKYTKTMTLVYYVASKASLKYIRLKILALILSIIVYRFNNIKPSTSNHFAPKIPFCQSSTYPYLLLKKG